MNYYPERLKTDALLYTRFMELGGKPLQEHPLSFVLQGSDYLNEWLDFNGRIARLGWTPSTTYIGIRISDGMLIGMIDIRHELSGFLLKYNGQIGYSVRPSERKKGYASQMLLLVLKEAENLGYKKVLVCCNKKNIQSSRVIQKCGGVLENEVIHEFSPVGNPDIIQRYWIETDCSYQQ